ncbi:PH domain-containing protein [Pseudomarimonas salicorniae]|uniref:PH domain-containing protein n=1 Tax=Pseudomarimonas salicorniae TaxID=2933270 RepID=A0ABT0GJB5_9GAMM|nr:PH domain-containing protein [Lysobacter sp. CAU 1642]MCK7594105.1 PH domain-containing protein [Lysobacter sp. CAU 1642]
MPAMSEQSVVRAEFNPLIRSYLLLSAALVMVMTIVGIPLALVWLLGIGQWWAGRYYRELECELDNESLRFRKGILFQVEKTIPLENIQDVTFIEGPLLRRFELSTLKFETAGSSGAQAGASDMQLTGIVGAAELRREILRRRNLLRRGGHEPASDATEPTLEMLTRISGQLDQVIALLRERP